MPRSSKYSAASIMISSFFLLLLSISGGEAFSPVFATTSFGSRAMSTSSSLKLSENEVIDLAKDYVEKRNGFYAPIDGDFHSEDFVFRAGIVGPLNKVDYIDTMTKLGIANVFDIQPNAFGFCVDPEDPLTTRFFLRYTGRQVKPWSVANTPISIPVTNEPIQGPTEAVCIKFNEEGKVQFFSISQPIIYGNPNPSTTNNVGAVLGLFHHVGASDMASLAMNSNVRAVNNAAAQLLGKSNGAPMTKSKAEDMPAWYNEC
jgi:hypothetical protein